MKYKELPDLGLGNKPSTMATKKIIHTRYRTVKDIFWHDFEVISSKQCLSLGPSTIIMQELRFEKKFLRFIPT